MIHEIEGQTGDKKAPTEEEHSDDELTNSCKL